MPKSIKTYTPEELAFFRGYARGVVHELHMDHFKDVGMTPEMITEMVEAVIGDLVRGIAPTEGYSIEKMVGILIKTRILTMHKNLRNKAKKKKAEE
jgi:hypothetical protein